MTKTDEIKEFLDQGKTIKEIIAKGFTKPLVYKVNKAWKNSTKVAPEPTQELSKEVKEEPTTVIEKLPEEVKEEPTTVIETIPKEVKEEPTTVIETIPKEIFTDDDTSPFREFNEVSLHRNSVSLPSNAQVQTIKAESKTIGQFQLAELLAQLFATVSALTGHDFWELKPKDEKVIKHLCKIPALEKFLQKFGSYGCCMGLFVITVSRLKQEIALKKSEEQEPEREYKQPQETILKDAPANVMDGFTNET